MPDYGGLPFGTIENNFLRLDYLTTTGPRIVGLYVSGVEGNLLAVTPEVHWETPHGEYYLRGGHRLWTAPEDPFYTCPENGLDVAKIDDGVILKSPVDASGLEKEIEIQLENNCVYLTHRIKWHGERMMEFAPWAITQLRLGSLAILPLANVDGLLPDRNIVLWPYSNLRDERLELFDDMILLHGRAESHALKIGNRNSLGWLACAMGDALFVKRFSTNMDARYADLNSNVETYVKDVCVELETLGSLVNLERGESVTHEETWQVFAGEYPPTVECAGRIKKQLSQSIMNGENNGK